MWISHQLATHIKAVIFVALIFVVSSYSISKMPLLNNAITKLLIPCILCESLRSNMGNISKSISKTLDPVSHSPHRFYNGGILRIVLYLFPQALYINGEGVVIDKVARHIPYALEQLIPGQHSSPIGDKRE